MKHVGTSIAFFLERSVMRMEPVIQEKVDRIRQRFEMAYLHDTIIPLYIAFGAMVADMVTLYFFCTSLGILS